MRDWQRLFLEKITNMKNKQKPAISEAEIGMRIKTFRNQKKITLDKLAQQTGFTRGYLSKVEKSKKSPPVFTLAIIARALGVNVSALLGEGSPAPVSISLVKKGERTLISRKSTAYGYTFEAIAYKYPNKKMEAFILTLPLNFPKKTVYHHEGEEILFVLEGTMKFHHNNLEYIVEEGDCVYFDANLPHYGESMGKKEVKCLMVIYNAVNQ